MRAESMTLTINLFHKQNNIGGLEIFLGTRRDAVHKHISVRPCAMMTRVVLLTTIGMVVACAETPQRPAPTGPDLPPSQDLPLLPGGNHAGVVVGFNSELPVATATAVDARWYEAVAAGMRIGRVQLDWKDVEPNPKQYDLNELEERLKVVSADGLRPFLLLDSIDGQIPSDLRKGLDANELTWDHPTVIARHAEMLRRIMPVLRRHHVWILSIANEVGNLLDKLEPTQRAETTQQMIAFATAARSEVKQLEPDLAVAITVREQQFEAGDTEAAFVAFSDVASFNFYCSRFVSGLEVQSNVEAIRGYIDAMFARAGDKSVVVQELGCHAGYTDRPSVTRANPDLQARFFDVVLGELAARPRFRAAIVFQMIDWNPELVESEYSNSFRAEGVPETFIGQFAESLETVGLLRLNDGTARPAWATFISHL